MSIRVGIITMHRPINIGCALQAYATCQTFKKLGLEPEIIDYYYPNKLHHQDGIIRKIQHYGNRFLAKFLIGNAYPRKEKRFSDFLTNDIQLSKPYYTYEQLKNASLDYDIYCSGSDQIWNPKYICGDDTFLCSFVQQEQKCFSYASSFGVSSLNEIDAELYKKQLNKYIYISCRERSGVKLVQSLGLKAEFVLDPTLLLTHDEWLNIASPIELPTKPYILCYGNEVKNMLMEKLGREYAKEHGYMFYRIGGFPWKRYAKGIDYLFDIGPKEFITLFSNANGIITSSFHGTAFALNFNKPVNSFISHNSEDTRVSGIMEELGLSDNLRYIEDTNTKIDFTSNNQYWEKLNKLKDDSLQYISNVLKI